MVTFVAPTDPFGISPASPPPMRMRFAVLALLALVASAPVQAAFLRYQGESSACRAALSMFRSAPTHPDG